MISSTLRRHLASVATLCMLATSGAFAAAAKDVPLVDGPPLAPRIHAQVAIYFPAAPATDAVAALAARLASDNANPRLVKQLAETGTAFEVDAHWTTHALKDFAPPSAQMLEYFGRGLSPSETQALPKADKALVLEFAYPARDRFTALRHAELLVDQVAADTHGLVWDNDSREAFTPVSWHKRRVASWAGDVPDVAMHSVIHFYRNDDGSGYRFVTVGMARFGLPDLSIEDAIASESRPLGNMVNVTAQALVEGALTDAAGRLDVRLQASRHPGVAKAQGEDVLPGAQRVAHLLLVQGRRDEGDADNRLLRIAFDRYDGPDEHARQAALGTALFGSEDGVTRIRHDARLLAARDAARAKMPELRDRFNRGLRPGEVLMVKAPFATDHEGREWMWVEVAAWKGDRITGTLQNTPDDVQHLKQGQDVVVSQAELFDYLFKRADGTLEGNTTGAIIQEQAKK